MNPFALWAEIWLKSGQAMLDSLQRSSIKAPAPKVAVIPAEDAPKPAARKKARKPRVNAKAKAPAKAGAKGKRKARR